MSSTDDYCRYAAPTMLPVTNPRAAVRSRKGFWAIWSVLPWRSC